MSQYIYVIVTNHPLAEYSFESADELIEFLCDEQPSVYSIRKLWGLRSTGKDDIFMREKQLIQNGVALGRIPF